MRGQFACCLKDRGPLKTAGNLVGMRSHMIGYLAVATGLLTFIVHGYVDDTGNIGASGLLDPKWLYEDGVIYTSNRRAGAADLG